MAESLREKVLEQARDYIQNIVRSSGLPPQEREELKKLLTSLWNNLSREADERTLVKVVFNPSIFGSKLFVEMMALGVVEEVSRLRTEKAGLLLPYEFKSETVKDYERALGDLVFRYEATEVEVALCFVRKEKEVIARLLEHHERRRLEWEKEVKEGARVPLADPAERFRLIVEEAGSSRENLEVAGRSGLPLDVCSFFLSGGKFCLLSVESPVEGMLIYLRQGHEKKHLVMLPPLDLAGVQERMRGSFIPGYGFKVYSPSVHLVVEAFGEHRGWMRAVMDQVWLAHRSTSFLLSLWEEYVELSKEGESFLDYVYRVVKEAGKNIPHPESVKGWTAEEIKRAGKLSEKYGVNANAIVDMEEKDVEFGMEVL